MDGPHTLLIDQAAGMLGVSRRTIYYRIREGRLRTVRTRGGTQRVLAESIEELLREIQSGRASATGKAVRSEPGSEPEALSF